MGKPLAVVLDGYALNPGDLTWSSLETLAELTVHDRTAENVVLERSRNAQLLLTNKTPLDAKSISLLPNLRYIGVLATGYNIVDIASARRHGVTVTNIPTYGTASVAQFVVALLLELCHNVRLHSDAVRAGEWTNSLDWCFWKAPLVELAGKTLGIVGFGRIGRKLGTIATALEMKVIANDTCRQDPPGWPGFRFAPLEGLLRESDVVSLHCPLLPDTLGLINRERLKLMKPSAFLINTSRGPLVADRDLADALNSGLIAGAALDVLSAEPPAAGNPLLSARNCIITPHIAWATREARARLMQIGIENVAAFLSGSPQNVVS
jgi:glycerate dehydrogenase